MSYEAFGHPEMWHVCAMPFLLDSATALPLGPVPEPLWFYARLRRRRLSRGPRAHACLPRHPTAQAAGWCSASRRDRDCRWPLLFMSALPVSASGRGTCGGRSRGGYRECGPPGATPHRASGPAVWCPGSGCCAWPRVSGHTILSSLSSKSTPAKQGGKTRMTNTWSLRTSAPPPLI